MTRPTRAVDEPHGRIVAPTVIAVLTIAGFVSESRGLALVVTFVPAMALAWGLTVFRTRRYGLPSRERLTAPFLAAFGVQFLHFAEEYAGDFQTRFPVEIFGAKPYSDVYFVVSNMVSYAVFLGAFVASIWYRRAAPVVLVWFVVVMMTLGNAVGHVVWSAIVGGYFPGLWTSLAYWFIGPVLLARMWAGERGASVTPGDPPPSPRAARGVGGPAPRA